MPNIKSAKKRVITSNERNEKNVAQKSAMRTCVKKATVAVANKEAGADEAVKAAAISLDKAASKGLIKKNAAARKKSRMAKALNATKA